MKRFIHWLPSLAFAVGLTGCGDSLGPPGDPILGLPRELSLAAGRLIEADNSFALKLFREINRQQGDTNIFISPSAWRWHWA